MVATAKILFRWALCETRAVAIARTWDLILLLVAIAVAYVARGATRHQVLRSLADTAWFLVALVVFLMLVFAVRLVQAARRLRGHWNCYVTGEPTHPALHLEPTSPTCAIVAARCRVSHADGSPPIPWEWHGPAAWNNGLGPMANYPATFIPVPGDGLQGEHQAEWFWKEIPSDGWIRAWRGRFVYKPETPTNLE